MDGEFFWNKLLRYIDEGHVIPIVGPDLLRVKTGDGDRLFYPWLAWRVAHDLGLTEDIEWSFHEVGSRTVARGGQLDVLDRQHDMVNAINLHSRPPPDAFCHP